MPPAARLPTAPCPTGQFVSAYCISLSFLSSAARQNRERGHGGCRDPAESAAQFRQQDFIAEVEHDDLCRDQTNPVLLYHLIRHVGDSHGENQDEEVHGGTSETVPAPGQFGNEYDKHG